MDAGRLATAATPDLLRQYATAGATGCLRLDRDAMQARVYFRDGLVYAATAPGARARLGDRLVGAGHITEEELAATLEHQRALPEPRRIGELLIEQGLIDRETMRSFVREQSTDSVAVALGWQEGEWTFTAGEEVPEDVPLDMSVENLVMEGARRLEEWEVIQSRIGSVDAVPDFVSGDGTAELALTPDEWSMLTRIDGRSTIAEIADEAGYSEFDAGRIIYGLLTAGIVTLVGDEDLDAAEELEPAEEPTAATEADPAADQADADAWWTAPEPEGEAAAPMADAEAAHPDAEPAAPMADAEAASPDAEPAAPMADAEAAHPRPAEPEWITDFEFKEPAEPDRAGEVGAEPGPQPGREPWQAPEAEPGAEPERVDEPRFDPGAASELFGELGLGDPDAAGSSPAAEESEPDDAGAAVGGADLEPPRPPPPPEPPGGPVNRNELLREFAALDDPDGGAPEDSPPRPSGPPRTPRRDEDSDKDKRKGLFGRLRRD